MITSSYMVTTTRIVRIGNSQGIRIPKAVLEQAELPEEVVLRAEPGRLVVTAARTPRRGGLMPRGRCTLPAKIKLLDEAPPSVFDDEEWEW